MVGPWDPEWIEFAKTMGEAPSLPADLEGKKAMVEGLFMMSTARLPPPPGDIIAKDLQVPDGPKVRVYRPGGEHEKPLPMVIFYHGGGWFAGNLDTEDRSCRMVCHMTPAWVVSVEYRCSAQTSLEDEVEDCYRAFEWARGRAESHGVDPGHVVIWGGSAGGVLATAVVYRLIQEGKGHHVAGLVSMCPLQLHPDATPEKYKQLNTSYVDNAGLLPFVSGHDTLWLYSERKIEPPNTNVNLFPVAGGPDAVRAFPPTFLISCENDASRDDSTVFEAVLNDAGVPVKRHNVPGLAHYFWVFDLPKANAEFWTKLTQGIRWTLIQDRK